MFTAGKVIEDARGLDPAFHPRNHPTRVCLEFLSRFQRRLAGKLLQRERESISAEITIDLPLADHEAGEALLDGDDNPLPYDRIHGQALVAQDGTRYPVPMVPFKARFDADRWMFTWMRENVLHLSGTAQDWNGWDSIVVPYAGTPGLILTTSANMALPDNALDVLVLGLGAEMAKRNPELAHRKTLPAEAEKAEEDWLNLIEERNAAEVGSVRRVYSI